MPTRSPFLLLFLAVAVAGCSETPQTATGTGAEEAAREFYMALTRGDFAKAYALVEPARRQRLAEREFARRCRSQRETIGFEARELHIRSCEEHGDEAIAHIVLFGETPSGRRAYRDDLVLHRGMTGWGVVLSPHFGSPQVKRP